MSSRQQKIASHYQENYNIESAQKKHLRKISQDVLFPLRLPLSGPGDIVMIGSFDNVVLNEWANHWGVERCVGFDIVEYAPHECFVLKDVLSLSEEDDRPLSLVLNDLSFSTHNKDWEMVLEAYQNADKWSKRNIVKGGYLMEWIGVEESNFHDENFNAIEIWKNNYVRLLQRI